MNFDHQPPSSFSMRMRHHGGLDRVEREALDEACGNGHDVPAAQDLVREGDSVDAMYVVLDGLACRYKVMPGARRQILSFVLPGEACNVRFDALDEIDHSIATLVPSRIVALSRRQVDALAKDSDAVARALEFAIQIECSIARAWIANLGRRSSTERLAHLICELYVRLAQVGLARGDRADIPVTQVMLADALGLTAVHVNRVLRTLRDAEIMTMERDVLIVNQPEKLARIAGFDDAYLHRGVSAAG